MSENNMHRVSEEACSHRGERATHSSLGNRSKEDDIGMRVGYGNVPGDEASEADRSRSAPLNLAAHRIIEGALKK